MHVVVARNVNTAFEFGLNHLRMHGIVEDSRAGKVMVAPTPVTTVYNRPRERVLFDARRDANPFFHLFESIWMLAGENDARWLDQFVHDFSSRFAEDSGLQWGAYGHRWRRSYDVDQLDVVVHRLRENHRDRRVVLAMWDVDYDLVDSRDEESKEPRDLPCNTHIYPRVRQERVMQRPVLDVTVCCRSNDVVWGAYGANAVHFSFLLEYLAARIGVGIGRMYQISNNFHGYLDTVGKFLQDGAFEADRYGAMKTSAASMVEDPEHFDDDLRAFMRDPLNAAYYNRWFPKTAVPMLCAHQYWRDGERERAIDEMTIVEAPDLRQAGTEWMERRL